MMTFDEFDNTSWGAKSKCITNDGKVYSVVSVNFGERLVGIDMFDDVDDPAWYRCESVDLVQ